MFTTFLVIDQSVELEIQSRSNSPAENATTMRTLGRPNANVIPLPLLLRGETTMSDPPPYMKDVPGAMNPEEHEQEPPSPSSVHFPLAPEPYHDSPRAAVRRSRTFDL